MGRPRKTPKVSERLVVYDVPMEDIYFDSDFNCRGEFTYESLHDLKDSIEKDDLINPVTVQPYSEMPGYDYRMVAGHRRFKTFQLLKRPTIPAFIRELTPRQAAILNFAENLIRTDLSVVQEAEALKKLYPDGFPSLRKMAKEIDQSEHWCHDRIRVCDLPEFVKSMLIAGSIPKQYIGELWKINDEGGESECIKAAKAIANARDRNNKVRRKKLPDHLKKFKYEVRSRTEIDRMIAKILDASIIGLAPRVGAWCAGYISDKELLDDIKKRVPKYKLRVVEETDE